MSENVERRLLKVLGNPTTSPYGNPIPGLEELGAEQTAPDDGAVRVSDLPQGEPLTVVVRRISEHSQSDPNLIAEFQEAGVVPSARVSITVGPEGATINTPGHDGMELSLEMAHSLFVQKL